MTGVSYITEHQENLRTILVMLHGPGLSMKDDLQLDTTQSPHTSGVGNEAIVVSRKDMSSPLRIPLPYPVPPAQSVPFVMQDLHLEAKLTALSPTLTSGISSFVDHVLSAADLTDMGPSALCCAACDREVAAMKSNQVFKDLPSEHWAEMMEVWMCHADPTFTARLAQQTRDGFWPSNGTVLVGGSYLLVEGSQTKKHNLRVEETTESGIPPTPPSLGYKKVIAIHQLAVS